MGMEDELEALRLQVAEMAKQMADLTSQLSDGRLLGEEPPEGQTTRDINISWLLLTSTIVFLMQLGFAMLECGSRRTMG